MVINSRINVLANFSLHSVGSLAHSKFTLPTSSPLSFSHSLILSIRLCSVSNFSLPTNWSSPLIFFGLQHSPDHIFCFSLYNLYIITTYKQHIQQSPAYTYTPNKLIQMCTHPCRQTHTTRTKPNTQTLIRRHPPCVSGCFCSLAFFHFSVGFFFLFLFIYFCTTSLHTPNKK